MTNRMLGTVISGSLCDGLFIRLHSDIELECIKTGKFIIVHGEQHRFFSLVTDIKLETSNPDILLFPPAAHEQLLRAMIQKNYLYAVIQVKPMLVLDVHNRIMPVKTIPSHFSHACEADAHDVALIFGNENDASQRYFRVGCPMDMDTPVCIDLERIAERSNGIFGKTGTGKTFLTRVVLAGLIKQQKAVNLIFDMHSEYGLQARQESAQAGFVRGLKQLFPDRVAIFSLDPQSTLRRGSAADVVVELSYQDIHIEDVISLQSELNLHPTALEAAYLIAAKYKRDWLSVLLKQGDQLKEFATSIGAHPESIAALYRKLKRLEKLSFITERATGTAVVDRMIEYLDRDINVVIEFGNYTASFCYLLVANVITRRIHEEYVAKTERFLGSKRAEDEPHKLMITIEEAHKFLNPLAAQQTIFGTIAREMRKYYVSLMVVDQRPSGIDSEVLSQIGTKLIAQLSDEKDIVSVLAGANNATSLRLVLASLDSKQQVLIVGHAVAMPVVVHARAYDEQFYREIGMVATINREQLIQEIFS